MTEVARQRTDYVTLLLDGVHDPHNVAAVLRSADAFGLTRVYAAATDQPIEISNKVARGAQRWVELIQAPAGQPLRERLRAQGMQFWVAAQHRDGCSLHAWRPDRPTAFVFGNEHRGVAPAWLDAADRIFEVPMVGMVESLNISVACAVTLARVRRVLETSHDVDWRLDAQAQADLIARWNGEQAA